MKKLSLALGLASLLTLGLVSAPRAARADVPPANSTCGDKKAGDSCTDDARQAGVCTASKCGHGRPGPDGVRQQHDCMLCIATTTATAPSSGASPSPTTAPTTDKKSHGCSTSGASTPQDGALFALAALAFLAMRRRR